MFRGIHPVDDHVTQLTAVQGSANAFMMDVFLRVTLAKPPTKKMTVIGQFQEKISFRGLETVDFPNPWDTEVRAIQNDYMISGTLVDYGFLAFAAITGRACRTDDEAAQLRRSQFGRRRNTKNA